MKQKATFEKVVEFHMHASGQFSARLAYVKDHPKLGNEAVVYTSALVKVEFDNGYPVMVETNNTIYTKA